MGKIPRTHRIHIAVLLLASFFIAWMVFVLLKSPLQTSKEVLIQEGYGVYVIADVLKKNGIIDNKFAFVVYTLATGNEKKLQAGKYIFQPGVTIPVIVYLMAKGLVEPDNTVITIPEGFNIFDIDERLVLLGLIKRGEFVEKHHRDEGHFFPDTYYAKNQNTKIKTQRNSLKFKNETKAVNEIVEKMIVNFEEKTRNVFRGLSIQKQEEVVVIASILEKEVRQEEDMRLVAGIIENRLTRGMSLQIDATVSYGACLRNLQSTIYNLQSFQYCDVSQIPVGAEIKIDGPYNTYTRVGLPVGPIANPGLVAIQAVLSPVKSDYLYYLSTRDGSQIIFSKTAAEHAMNRRKYLEI